MPSNPPSRYMTTIYHYFLSFLRQNRHKTCPELTKLHKNFFGEHAIEPSLQSWAPAEIFVGGGKPKKGSHHEVKRPPHGKKAPKNEKKIAKRPPYMKKK